MSRKKKPTPAADPTPLPPAADRVYRGRRGTGGAAVTVVDDGVERPLELRLDLRRHSPTGFGWGYAGSAAQLALALAADALGDDDRAQAVHQRLKAALVAGLPADGWELTADQVRAAVREIEQNRRLGLPATDGSGDHTVAENPPSEPFGRADPTGEQQPATASEPPSSEDARPVGEPTHAATHRPDGPRTPNPFGFRQDAAAGVRLLEDRKFRQMQLKFQEKPSDEVRLAVRDAGYRWREEELAWTKQIDPEKGWQTRADAEALFERVAAQIRAEKGVTHEHA